MADATRQYEGMFLLPVSADADGAVNLVKSSIEKYGGEIIVLKKWDERKLAYEIKKQKRGVYVIAFFNAAPKSIAPLEREVTLSENMLRVLITDASHLNKDEMATVEPQPIAPKEERNSWDRPYDDRPAGGPRGDRPARPRREEEAAAKD